MIIVPHSHSTLKALEVMHFFTVMAFRHHFTASYPFLTQIAENLRKKTTEFVRSHMVNLKRSQKEVDLPI